MELSVLKKIQSKDLWCVSWQPERTELSVELLSRCIDFNRGVFNRRQQAEKHGGRAILFIGTQADCKLFAEIVQEALQHDLQLKDMDRSADDQAG
ncbi:hypothetical protein CXB49_09310 [Chromobacterium sp. ATCC 53434]|nr:hypothetical protein CXB49_09310 [Chromobacterium sp. ATCC 53434]